MMGFSLLHGFSAAGAGFALLLLALSPHGTAAQTQEAAAPGSEGDWTATILEEDDFWAPHNRDRYYGALDLTIHLAF
jgi:hypothetical protein